MREIKFRVYIKKTKEMLPVVSIVQMNDEEWLRVFPKWYDRNFLESEWDIVLMQYTWLKDKNGKYIYDGDILKWEDSLWRLFVYPVTWCDDKSGFILDSENFSLWIYKKYKGFEIIGNVYENPELLKV